MNTMTETTGLFQLSVPRYSPLPGKAWHTSNIREPGGRNWCRGNGGGLHLRAYSASFLTPARTTHQWDGPTSINHQSLFLHRKNWGSGKWQPSVPEAETSRLAIGLVDCGSRMWRLSPQLCYFVSGSPWMLHLISWFHLQNGVQTYHGDVMSDYGWRAYIWA